VRLDAAGAWPGTYEGVLLDGSTLEQALAKGTRVTVRGVSGARPPLWLSAEAAHNLEAWTASCPACGFDLVLEALDTEAVAFTCPCALCGEPQEVRRRGHEDAPVPGPSPLVVARIAVPAVLGVCFLAYLFLN